MSGMAEKKGMKEDRIFMNINFQRSRRPPTHSLDDVEAI
jgi:hypothetical protein